MPTLAADPYVRVGCSLRAADLAAVAIIDVSIPGDPIPKGRPRSSRTGPIYTPTRTKNAEKVLQLWLRQAMAGAAPYPGEVGIAVEFSCATKRRSDGDNLLKLVTDAMNGIVLVDDSQIIEWFARIQRGVGRGAAQTQVLVYPL